MIEVDGQPTFVPTEDSRGNAWSLAGRGEPFVLTRDEQPASQVPADVRIRYRQGGIPKQSLFTLFTETRFRHELPPVQEAMALTLSGGDDWLGPIVIEPIDRPDIEDLKIISQAPGRSETETHTFSSKESQLMFLPRTQLEPQITSDVPLSRAELFTATGQAPALERIDPRHFVARWSMSEPLTLEIKLVDAGAPRFQAVFHLAQPAARPRAPRHGPFVGRRPADHAHGQHSPALRATDDFGLTAVGVEVEQTIHKSEKPETKTHAKPVKLPTTVGAAGNTPGSAGPLTDLKPSRSWRQRTTRIMP